MERVKSFRVSDSNPNTEFTGAISVEPSLTGAPTPGSLARISLSRARPGHEDAVKALIGRLAM